MGLLDDYKQLLTNERTRSRLKGLLEPLSQQVTSNLESNFPFLFKDPRQLKPEDAAGLLGGGIAGTFIGPKSATWNKEIADKAAGLLDAGVDPAKVWKEHLIGRMPDGALFSEIDDSAAKVPDWLVDKYIDGNNIDRTGSMGTNLWHKQLYESYPDFRQMPSRLKITNEASAPWEAANRGSFNGDSVLINSGTSGEAKSTALHELQHAIQQREGWARGGSPESFRPEYEMNQRIIDYHRKKFHELKSSIKESPEYQQLSLARDAAIDKGDSNLAIEYSNKIGDLIDKTGANNHYDIWKKTEAETLHPIDAYRRLTGEAQARATQDRLNMSMDERRANYPLQGGLLSDIPLEQLIYRYDNVGPSMAIDVYHGSPHKFDAFDMSKIGTGEGAQAYGHGLYFAENPDVAKQYAENVQLPKSFTHDDYKSLVQYKRQQRLGNELSKDDKAAFDDLMARKLQYEDAVNSQNNLYNVSLEWPDAAREAADPLGPQHFLDWDKPLSQQPDSVKNAWGNLFGGLPAPQGSLGRTLKGLMAEDDLKAEGIPGIRYLDGGSRGAGDGSYNYVVFDDQIPRILERNGKPLKGLLDK